MAASACLNVNGFIIAAILLTINLVHPRIANQINGDENKYSPVKSSVIESAACDSEIYCIGGDGTILHTVQMARLYNDSKEFVDKPLKAEPNHTLRKFDTFMRVNI